MSRFASLSTLYSSSSSSEDEEATTSPRETVTIKTLRSIVGTTAAAASAPLHQIATPPASSRSFLASLQLQSYSAVFDDEGYELLENMVGFASEKELVDELAMKRRDARRLFERLHGVRIGLQRLLNNDEVRVFRAERRRRRSGGDVVGAACEAQHSRGGAAEETLEKEQLSPNSRALRRTSLGRIARQQQRLHLEHAAEGTRSLQRFSATLAAGLAARSAPRIFSRITLITHPSLSTASHRPPLARRFNKKTTTVSPAASVGIDAAASSAATVCAAEAARVSTHLEVSLLPTIDGAVTKASHNGSLAPMLAGLMVWTTPVLPANVVVSVVLTVKVRPLARVEIASYGGYSNREVRIEELAVDGPRELAPWAHYGRCTSRWNIPEDYVATRIDIDPPLPTGTSLRVSVRHHRLLDGVAGAIVRSFTTYEMAALDERARGLAVASADAAASNARAAEQCALSIALDATLQTRIAEVKFRMRANKAASVAVKSARAAEQSSDAAAASAAAVFAIGAVNAKAACRAASARIASYVAAAAAKKKVGSAETTSSDVKLRSVEQIKLAELSVFGFCAEQDAASSTATPSSKSTHVNVGSVRSLLNGETTWTTSILKAMEVHTLWVGVTDSHSVVQLEIACYGGCVGLFFFKTSQQCENTFPLIHFPSIFDHHSPVSWTNRELQIEAVNAQGIVTRKIAPWGSYGTAAGRWRVPADYIAAVIDLEEPLERIVSEKPCLKISVRHTRLCNDVAGVALFRVSTLATIAAALLDAAGASATLNASACAVDAYALATAAILAANNAAILALAQMHAAVGTGVVVAQSASTAARGASSRAHSAAATAMTLHVAARAVDAARQACSSASAEAVSAARAARKAKLASCIIA